MAGGDVLEMINIDKRFGGIHALRGFNFSCAAGEVHVLMGENVDNHPVNRRFDYTELTEMGTSYFRLRHSSGCGRIKGIYITVYNLYQKIC